jgi:hypothetical protein
MNGDARRVGVVNHSGALEIPGVPAIPVAELADAFNRGTIE